MSSTDEIICGHERPKEGQKMLRLVCEDCLGKIESNLRTRLRAERRNGNRLAKCLEEFKPADPMNYAWRGNPFREAKEALAAHKRLRRKERG